MNRNFLVSLVVATVLVAASDSSFAKSINGCEIRPNTDCSNVDLSGVKLPLAKLRGANLQSANLSGTNLAGANLSGANLKFANLTNANLKGANLTGANLKEATLTNAKLANAKLVSAILQYTVLDGANLSKAKLVGADLYGASLKNTNLKKANLTDADLTATDITGAVMVGTKLQNVVYDSPDPGRDSTGDPNSPGSGGTDLVLAVPGVAENQYSKLTLMSQTELTAANVKSNPDINFAKQYLLEKFLSLFGKKANADAWGFCTSQLVGMNKSKDAWEVLTLTTDKSAVCVSEFQTAGDYVIAITQNLKLKGGYCNLLMMRKTDGKLFCGSESSAVTYTFGFSPKPIEVSGNGRYALLQLEDQYASMQIFIIRLDLLGKTGMPELKIVWVGPGGYRDYNELANILDHAPTNSGNLFLSYSIGGRQFNKYIEVNAALDDPESNIRTELPFEYDNIKKIEKTFALYPDPSATNMNSCILQSSYSYSSDPIALRVNASNRSDIKYSFLGTTHAFGNFGYARLKDGVYGSIYLNSTSGMYMTGPFTLEYNENAFTEGVDFATVTLPAILDPMTWGPDSWSPWECGDLGGGSCNTDNLVFSDSTSSFSLYSGSKSVVWVGSVAWIGWNSSMSMMDTDYNRLYKLDIAGRLGTNISIPTSISIKAMSASSKYPGDLIISGIDYDVGMTGSPFAARITGSGELVDYSVLPATFKSNGIKVVEL